MHNLVCVRRSVRKTHKNSTDTRASHPKLRNESKVKVFKNILETVGNTPLVKLNKIPKSHGVSCEIFVKCEFMNPGGSIKDRIAKTMIEDAVIEGVVTKTTRLVEPTSGNTGIGIALNTAFMGNKSTIVTTQKNDGDKVDTMRLLGAEVIMIKDTDDAVSVAQSIRDNSDTTIMLDQFANEVNPLTHYETTAEEIASALDRVDMVVMGAGTGGTVTGVGTRMKKLNPKCVITVAEPDGSTMINANGNQHPFLVEGIGGNWIPSVLNKSVIDHVEVVTDKEAFLMARELARTEALLCGGSSGAAVSAAIKAAKFLKLGADQRIVVILPDGIRNYMTKFVKDQWMEAHLFQEPPKRSMKWWLKPITELDPKKKYPILEKSFTCDKALRSMTDVNIAIVTDADGCFVGAVTKDSLRNNATNPPSFPPKTNEEFDFDEAVSEYLMKHCYTLAKNGKQGIPTIGLLSRILDITPFVVIVNEDEDVLEPVSVVTADDVMDYIYNQRNL